MCPTRILSRIRDFYETLHRNEDIYELKGVHTATFEPHLFSRNVEHCSISNVNSYQCSSLTKSNTILNVFLSYF